MISKEKISKLIPLPESNRLQYDAVLPSTNEIGRLISGYANTDGGVLILGVLSKNKKVAVTGLSNDFQVELVLRNAQKKLKPMPAIESQYIEYEGKRLFVLEVEKSTEPVYFDDVQYCMKNKEIVRLNDPWKGVDTNSGVMEPELISKPKSVFISYNWSNKQQAQKLYDFFASIGFSVRMDDHDLSYKGHISTFMESIRDSDFAILILSDEYLKSANCMTEVLHVLKDKDCIKKILPIRHNNAKFFSIPDRLSYVTFWLSKVKETEEHLKGVEATFAIEEYKKLKVEKSISQSINDFLSTISDMITYTIEEQERHSYKDIVQYINRH